MNVLRRHATAFTKYRWTVRLCHTISKDVMNSVVKVYATVCAPNYLIPWSKKIQQSSTGSGFVIDRKRRLLMTNAHVILDSVLVEVRKEGSGDKYVAKVVYTGVECDMALLTVHDNEFWEGLTGLDLYTHHKSLSDTKKPDVRDVVEAIKSFDGVPDIQESVRVVGYPVGGDQVSVTSGVVSRVDTQPYVICVHTHLIAIQIDAAINAGNSGGPAVSNDKVIGVSFQSLTHADNISYIIPVPVIAHFLRQYYALHGKRQRKQAARDPSCLPTYTDRSYHPGFCSFGCYVQDPLNEHLRKYMGLSKKQTGILIKKVVAHAASEGVMRDNDVLLSIDGMQVANDGTVKFGSRRVRFDHVMHMKEYLSTSKVRVLRNKKEITLKMQSKVMPSLVLSHNCNPYMKQKPKYHTFGGLVFTPLTVPYLKEWGQDWYSLAPTHLLQLTLTGRPAKDLCEVVVLAQMLPHQVNQGYQSGDFVHHVVESLNDKKVQSLRHLTQMLADLPNDGYARFEMKAFGTHQSIILRVGEARAANREVLDVFSIPKISFL